MSSKVTYHLGEELHCPHATRLQYLRDSGRLSEVLKWDTLPSKARSVWTRGWHWNVHSFQHCQTKEMTNEIYLNGGVKSSMTILMFQPTVRASLLNEPCLFFFCRSLSYAAGVAEGHSVDAQNGVHYPLDVSQWVLWPHSWSLSRGLVKCTLTWAEKSKKWKNHIITANDMSEHPGTLTG